MLLKIVLHNWRSHAHSVVQLGGGANIFLGQMGSGKSSVVDALCFALYGTYPKLGRRDTKLEEVANFRHRGEPAWVEVEWSDEGEAGQPSDGAGSGRMYKVRRELDPPQAWLYGDGKLLQKGPKAVTAEVERVLAIPYELFARAVYAEQNKMDYWLALPAGSRKAELDKLLGLDSFEQARGRVSTRLNAMKEQVQALEAEAPAQRLDEARAQYRQRQAELEAHKREGAATAERLAQMEAQVKAAQAQYEEGEKTQRHLQALGERRQKWMGTVSALEKTLAGPPALVDAAGARQKLSEAQTQTRAARAAAQEAANAERAAAQEKGKLEAQAKAEQERAARAAAMAREMEQALLGRSVEQLQSECAAQLQRLSEQSERRAGLQARAGERRKVMEALSVHPHARQMMAVGGKAGAGMGGTGVQGHSGEVQTELEAEVSCPVCRQPLDERRVAQLLNEEQAELVRLQDEQAECAQAIEGLKSAQEKLARTQAQVARLQAQLLALAPGAGSNAAEGARALAAQAAAQARQAAVEAQAKLDQALKLEQAAVEQLSRLEQRAAGEQQLEAARRGLRETEAEMAAISFSPQIWSDLVERREKLMREQAGLMAQEKSQRALTESSWQLCEAARLVAEQLEGRRNQAAAQRQQMDELGSFRNLLVATQSQMRAQLIAQINSALGKLWPLIYPYGDWTGVRLEATEKDYAVQIHQGEWKALEAHASGGERACLGLCLRTSLSILLTPQLGWLILDEPTHNLDGRAVQQLGRAMSEKLPQIIGQVVVITHEGQLLESTPGRVLRFERDKEKGEDTRIEMQ